MYSVSYLKEDRILYLGGGLGVRMYSEGELSIRTICPAPLSVRPSSRATHPIWRHGLNLRPFIPIRHGRVEADWSLDQTKNSTRL